MRVFDVEVRVVGRENQVVIEAVLRDVLCGDLSSLADTLHAVSIKV